MKEVWFIRHCESVANAGLATLSPESIALTEKGLQQAQYIPSVFTTNLELIVTSPFLRTKQTAEPTVLKFSNIAAEEWKVQEFTYLSLTKFANTTMAFRRPFVQKYWDQSEANYCDDDGCESFTQFISRIKIMVENIYAKPEQKIAVFTHGQFIKALLWNLINNFPKINNASMKSFSEFLGAVSVPNATILKVNFNDSEPKFLFSNLMTSHLPGNFITF